MIKDPIWLNMDPTIIRLVQSLQIPGGMGGRLHLETPINQNHPPFVVNGDSEMFSPEYVAEDEGDLC